MTDKLAERIAWKLNDQTDCHDPECVIGDTEGVAQLIAAELREAESDTRREHTGCHYQPHPRRKASETSTLDC